MKDSAAETSGVEEGVSHTLGQEHDLKMSSPPTTSAETPCPPLEELECKICYQRYNANNRKPKILDCLHRVCSRCLVKILDVTDGAGCVPCPFCRHQTEITEYQVSALPDDVNIMSHLTTREKFCSLDKKREVVLTPKNLSSTSPSHDSSNCLVITIMEVQRDLQHSPSHNGSSDIYADQSLDSVSIGSNGPTDHDALSKLCNHVPRILVWLLGFLYFGSLPLGIYLLVIQRVTLGIVCVSLVPSSLTVCLVYGFCQCLCQGMCDCFARG
ncbi:PREDICTED: E3 ubiquitin-protein ligase RNF182-like isoform X1 [Poecilia mexicana]|uniref:E3 ubiquitin-protein ligase RNF182-like isoform X1 n=2 Tax=Poecilia mexicana TaxID=48701 RepID=UPI00072E68C1|nr:PREDICTED: E3 ubiquitin-protein ligase RNF182-like isoform X1 [Poecilia mexicana]